MTIEHHPNDMMLSAFAAGTLDLGTHIAVATHLVSCSCCRGFAHSMEQIAGDVLSEMPPAAMACDALARIQARLGEPARGRVAAVSAPVAVREIPRLPDFVRSYQFADWKWIAPSVHLRPIRLPAASATRVFLLRSAPGTKMVQHTHTDLELTCVLSGSFSHEGGRYGPGDFDLGDGTVDHAPVVGDDEPCICLVAMQGELRLKGLIGRFVQPFVRL